MLFGLYSGQRLGDIATLRWNNIDLTAFFNPEDGKDDDPANSEALRKYIESLSAPGDPSAPLHPKAFNLLERHRNTGNLSDQFADLLAAAGLRQKRNHKSIGKGRGSRRDVEPLSFHSLRRTAATLLHEAVPAAVAQALIWT